MEKMNQNKSKMVICIRRDLNMRKGKAVAQACHSVLKVFFDWGHWEDIDTFKIPNLTPAMVEWMSGAFTKIVVGVNSEEEIYQLAEQAKEVGIPHAVIIDNGFTEFHGNKTTTCIAIGPDESEKIDKITGNLELI